MAPKTGQFFRESWIVIAVLFAATHVHGQVNIGVGGVRLQADQSGSRSLVGQSASLTVPNGGSGQIFSGSVRPFVIGFIPVVGGGGVGIVGGLPIPYVVSEPTFISPVRQALDQIESGAAPPLVLDGSFSSRSDETRSPVETRLPAGPISSAEQGDISVKEIRHQLARQDRAREKEVAALLAQASKAQAKGKPAVAKIYYQMAARRTQGGRNRDILARIRSLDE